MKKLVLILMVLSSFVGAAASMAVTGPQPKSGDSSATVVALTHRVAVLEKRMGLEADQSTCNFAVTSDYLDDIYSTLDNVKSRLHMPMVVIANGNGSTTYDDMGACDRVNEDRPTFDNNP